jgi:hypothetical protein
MVLALRKRYTPWHAAKLLYIGISPNRLSKPPKHAIATERIQSHYRGECRRFDAAEDAWHRIAEESLMFPS